METIEACLRAWYGDLAPLVQDWLDEYATPVDPDGRSQEHPSLSTLNR